MNNNQFRRYQKIFFEEFYLLDWQNNLDDYNFALSGSTNNIYTIKICKKNKCIECSCIDFKENCKNIICKHCCFILFFVLKLFYKFKPHFNQIKLNRPNGYNMINTSLFFENYILSNIEMLLISKYFKLINTQKSYINTNYINKYKYIILLENQKRVLYRQFTNKIIPIDKEITCGICFLKINSIDKYLSCPDCDKFIHKKCMLEWLKKKENCIYCRSEIWKDYFSLEIGKQLNLFQN